MISEITQYCPEFHWEEVSSWYRQRGMGDLVRAESMSPLGAVVYDESGPFMAGFLYLTKGCNVCFIERLISRPGITLNLAREASRQLLFQLGRMAQAQGYEECYCHIDRESVARELAKIGFARYPGEGILMYTNLKSE